MWKDAKHWRAILSKFDDRIAPPEVGNDSSTDCWMRVRWSSPIRVIKLPPDEPGRERWKCFQKRSETVIDRREDLGEFYLQIRWRSQEIRFEPKC